MTNLKIKNGNVNLEISHTSIDSTKPGLVFIHGMGGSIETWKQDLDKFKNNNAVALSLRGRGNSDAPESGYTLSDHVSDVRATIDHFKFSKSVFVANSAGVTWAVAYALEHPEKVSNLILIDRVPVNIPVSEDWVSTAKNDPNCPIQPTAIDGIARESDFVNLFPRLRDLKCPVFLLKGALEGSHLTDEDMEDYKNLCPNIEIIMLPNSGHGVSDEDSEVFWNVVDSCLV